MNSGEMRTMDARWASKSWGSWHTGPAARMPCPQDERWHTEDEAARLNEKDREFKNATLHESMRRWRESR